MKPLAGNKDFTAWVLAIDPHHPEKPVVCPTCKTGKLHVEISNVGKDSQTQTIFISCPVCNRCTHSTSRHANYPVTLRFKAIED